MLTTERYERATDALDQADAAVRELHEQCCQPLRSPRMERLAETLETARTRLGEISDDPDTATDLVEVLEDAGAQLGHLQVACCAPARMKLYGETLVNLFTVQRTVKQAFSLEH